MRKPTLFTVLALLGIASAGPASGSALNAPPPTTPGISTHADSQGRSPRVYVASQEAASITVIDVATNKVVATVDLQKLGFAANAKPHHIVVEPDGSYWYVSLIAAGRVLKFSYDNELVGQAEFEVPGMLALHPTEDLLFVGRSMAAVNPPQSIGIIRRSDMEIEEVATFFPRPHAIAVDPRGGYVYTGSLAVNQIATIDIESQGVELTDVPGDNHVFVQFAISQDGTRLVSTAQQTSKLLVFDSTEPNSLKLLRTVDVNRAPWHPVFSPDGHYLYFGNQGANTVTIVDTGTWSVAGVIEGEGLAEPHGSAVSPDGKYLYISNHNMKGDYKSPHGAVGTVVVIDLDARKIVKVIEVGIYGAGMGLGPVH
jgi:YVTN family beta-propeller protein